MHRHIFARAAVIAALLLVRSTSADVLPDNRADVFYSKYSGGGMDITGYSATARAKITENFAVEANYFIDKVSGASIDVLSQASVIKDERKQKSGTLEYLHDKTTYTASYTSSVERDYISDTASFSLEPGHVRRFDHGDAGIFRYAQQSRREQRHRQRSERRLDRTRPYARVQRRRLANSHQELYRGRKPSSHHRRRLSGESLSVDSLSRSFESQGLQPRQPGLSRHPHQHRSAGAGEILSTVPRRGNGACTGTTTTPGEWSATPTNSITPIRFAIVGYSKDGCAITSRLPASFYSDLFPFADSQNFTARDQNLAALDNTTVGAKVTYAFLPEGWKMFKRGTVTFDASRIRFNYLDFRNIKYFGVPQYSPGTEPLYNFNANVFQVFVSVYF